jgi:hypothetical protein
MNTELMRAYQEALNDLQKDLGFTYYYPVVPFENDDLGYALRFLLLAYKRSLTVSSESSKPS